MVQMIPTFVPEKDPAENCKSYETVDLVEKIQQKFPKHELQFWEFQEMTTCLPEVVVAIGIKVIIFYYFTLNLMNYNFGLLFVIIFPY